MFEYNKKYILNKNYLLSFILDFKSFKSFLVGLYFMS